jgi:DUF4097 and DUF4098 domain-containing protein YvlB
MKKTFDTPGQVDLTVENAVGLVVVTATETSTTEVSVEATTPDAQELVDRSTIECTPSGGRHVVRVKVPSRHGMRFMRRNAVTVRVTVPREAVVDVATASADIELRGPMGAVEVKTASGEVSADDVARHLRAKPASGDVIVGHVAGDLRMHTASGDLTCRRVGGRAEVASTSGDADLESVGGGLQARATAGNVRVGELTGDANIVAVSGHVSIRCAQGGSVLARSVSGDIEVGIARGVQLSVDAATMTGTVHSEIPLGDAPAGSAADPHVTLTLHTVSGNIEVGRAVGAMAG